MVFRLQESLPLQRFIEALAWTPLAGAYLYPLRFFGEERSTDPNDYLEVLRVLNVDGTDMVITRGGGLFARDHGDLKTGDAIDSLAAKINLVLCEFALHGIESHPVTDGDIQRGKLIGKHAGIIGGWGSHGERTWGPFFLIASNPRYMPRSTLWPPNAYWTAYDPQIIEQIKDLKGAMQLKSVGQTLPSLLVAAAHHCSRHNVGETIISSWIVCEQVLSYFWEKYFASISDVSRKQRLKDLRTYGAAVQAEVLLKAGKMDQNTYSTFQKARKVRNDLAHRAVVTHQGAGEAIKAMHAMLRMVGVPADRLIGYSIYGGLAGGPAPPQIPEPEFPFR